MTDNTPSQTDDAGVKADMRMVEAALNGERDARKEIQTLAHAIIARQTDRFCKRYCYDNKHHYACSLPQPWGSAPRQAALCEWGNASYTWMLEDLTSRANLRRYAGRGGARLSHYFLFIANSLPFYERWKDWRFGRNLHVPAYIKDMAPMAGAIFRGMAAGEDIAAIAQKQGLDPAAVQPLADKIIAELVRRKRLHLLVPAKTVSLTTWNHDEEDEHASSQADLPSVDPDWGELEQQQRMREAWEKLEPVEQFVLEATLIEQQDTQDVLAALKKLGLSIAKGVPAEKTDCQHLYYFRRKSLAKLARFMGVEG